MTISNLESTMLESPGDLAKALPEDQSAAGHDDWLDAALDWDELEAGPVVPSTPAFVSNRQTPRCRSEPVVP